jgi:transposase
MTASSPDGCAIMEPVGTERQARIARLGRAHAKAKEQLRAVDAELSAEMRDEYDEDGTPYETIARLTPIGTTQVYRMISAARRTGTATDR